MTHFIKNNVSDHEFKMHNYIYSLGVFNVPKIINYDKKNKTLTMEKINGMNISDMFGENSENVPDGIFSYVNTIIKNLKILNIEYPDITGYNFIIDNNDNDKIWIIDFEHSKINNAINNQFILDICNGEKKWNPDFK